MAARIVRSSSPSAKTMRWGFALTCSNEVVWSQDSSGDRSPSPTSGGSLETESAARLDALAAARPSWVRYPPANQSQAYRQPGKYLVSSGPHIDDAACRRALNEKLIAATGGKADVILSDMAPPTIGHRGADHLRIMALAEMALDFALQVLAPGGGFVAKLFQGGSERAMLTTLKQHFATVRHAKPPASRKDSTELYVVATGFRGG